MTSEVVRAALLATENPVRGKQPDNTAVGPKRAALGELTSNVPVAVVKPKKAQSKAPSKPSVAQKELAAPVPRPVIPVAAVPDVPEKPAGASLEEEGEQLSKAFSAMLLSVEDVDEHDGEQPQLCSEYAKSIYSYLHELEVQQTIRADYMKGYEITPNMRALLVDWLVQVHSRFQLLQETLFLTVAVLDRFLQVQPVSRRKLQLAGVTAMLVASKFEEMYVPEVGDFAYITDNAYTRCQILAMERVILRTIKFQLGRPLPLHFLRRYSKVANSDIEHHTLAKYLIELTLLDYNMVHYHPSEVAAAALCLSQQLLEGLQWSPMQQHYSSYSEDHLRPIMQHIAKNVVAVNEGKTKFMAVKNKYSSKKLLEVSRTPQLKSNVVKNMAAALLSSS